MLIDFSKIEQVEQNKPEFKEYPEGEYTFKVIEVKEEHPTDKSPSLTVQFETMGDNVFKFKNWFYLTDKALPIFLNFLSAVGLYVKGQKSNVEFENDDLLGCCLKGTLVKQEGSKYLGLKPYTCKPVETTKVKTTKSSNDTEEIPF